MHVALARGAAVLLTKLVPSVATGRDREAPGGPAGGQAGPKRGRGDLVGEEKRGRKRVDFLCFLLSSWRVMVFPQRLWRSGK